MLIYLCDDSESDLLRLEHYLTAYAKQKKLTFELCRFSSGESLLSSFQKAKVLPELIFLDIFMAELSGVDTANRLRDMHYEGGIIFTTSSTEHAMESYEVDALYYLQKPYDRTHFENAMLRCGKLLQKASPQFIFLRRKKEFSIPYTNIVFFEAGQAHSIFLHTVSGIYTFHGTLTQVAAQLTHAPCFLAVGRSFLINLNHTADRQENDLVMSDGSIVQIPLRKQEEIFARISAWQSQ